MLKHVQNLHLSAENTRHLNMFAFTSILLGAFSVLLVMYKRETQTTPLFYITGSLQSLSMVLMHLVLGYKKKNHLNAARNTQQVALSFIWSAKSSSLWRCAAVVICSMTLSYNLMHLIKQHSRKIKQHIYSCVSSTNMSVPVLISSIKQ